MYVLARAGTCRDEQNGAQAQSGCGEKSTIRHGLMVADLDNGMQRYRLCRLEPIGLEQEWPASCSG